MVPVSNRHHCRCLSPPFKACAAQFTLTFSLTDYKGVVAKAFVERVVLFFVGCRTSAFCIKFACVNLVLGMLMSDIKTTKTTPLAEINDTPPHRIRHILMTSTFNLRHQDIR
jgi:hypothetical protein